jgi:hypothetical protein
VSWPGLRGRLLCLLVLVLVHGHSQAGPGGGYDFQLEPAWQGHFKSGSAGFELAVKFLAPVGGRALLSINDAGALVTAEFAFEPGRAVTLHLPLVHGGANTLSARLEANGELFERQLQLRPLPPAKNLVAVVDHSNSKQWSFSDRRGEDLTLLHLSARDLPHSALAYQQLSHLPADLAGPGDALRSQAGCGGRYVMAAMPGNRSDWLPPAPGSPPGAVSLRQTLASADAGLARSLLVFLVGYLGVLLLLARSANSVLPLLALPPAAAVMALLAWSLSKPILDVSAWAEMQSGDAQARYLALARVTGTSRREVSVGLPAQWGPPRELVGGGATHLDYGLLQNHAAVHPLQLFLSTRLMSRHEFTFSGVLPGPRLEVRESVDTVRVSNLGSEPLAGGLVAWRGQRYDLPELAPGERWQAPERAESWGNRPEEQLLRQRAIGGGTWLLTPFRLPEQASGVGANSSAGWLLVKGVEDA